MKKIKKLITLLIIMMTQKSQDMYFQKENLLKKCNSIIYKFFLTKNYQNSTLQTYKLLSCKINLGENIENYIIEYLIKQNFCKLNISKEGSFLKIGKKNTFCTKNKITPKTEFFPIIPIPQKKTIHYLKSKKAICTFNPTSSEPYNPPNPQIFTTLKNKQKQKKPKITGSIIFSQKSPFDKTQIKLQISGLQKKKKHGFHIHKNGNLENSCKSAGSHFNPFNKIHGNPEESTKHVGDLGNIKGDDFGIGRLVEFFDFSLSGEFSVVGRSVVLHEGEDDLGLSGNSSGNSGARIACCVIGIVED